MIAKVILQKYSLPKDAFSYAVPNELQKEIKLGMLLAVPFRMRVEKALVLDVIDEEPSPSFKPVQSILNKTPVLLPFQIQISRWITEYYMCPLVKAVAPFLPKYIWEDKHEDWVQRTVFRRLEKQRGSHRTKRKKSGRGCIEKQE